MYVDFEVNDQTIRYELPMKDFDVEEGENHVADYCIEKFEEGQ